MDCWEIIAAVLGLCCVVLAGRRLTANFWLGYAYNIVLFVLFWKNGLYASMAVQSVAFAINAFGHWRWTHPREGEKDGRGALAVTRVRTDRYWIYLLAVTAVFCILSFMLPHTGDAHPTLDAASVSLILLAQWLSSQKKVECWWVWLLVNIMNIILYSVAGLWLMLFVACLYLANGVWSLISWKNNERSTENN